MAEAAVPAVDETRAKVAEYLAPFDDVVAESDGVLALSYGSATVRITVEVFDEDQASVKVRSQCVRGMAPSPELYHEVATRSTEIGHLRCIDEADGTVTLLFSHALMGEFLNPAELRMAVVAVAYLADQIDDEFVGRFGGAVENAQPTG